MSGAFPIGPMAGYEVLPDELEVVNCTGRTFYFAIHKEGDKWVVMLVTAEGASEINALEAPERYANDQND